MISPTSTVIRFLERQYRELRAEKGTALSRKCRRLVVLFVTLPLYPAAFTAILITRLLRPVVWVRFACLNSERIGHFTGNTEVYLCHREVSRQTQRGTFDIFYHAPTICNTQLKIMWERVLHVFWFAKWLDRVNTWLPGHSAHRVPMPGNSDTVGLIERVGPHLSFTAAEECHGRQALQQMDVDPDAAFIVFHNRTPSYLDEAVSGQDWTYHNYRDSSIANFIPAIETLCERDYYGIRIGLNTSERVVTRSDRIIDCATNGHRTDFMDIYLSAKCRFFVGDTAGITAVPTAFRRPVVQVNYIPMNQANTRPAGGLFIPKKFWLSSEKRLMTFADIFNSEVNDFHRTELYSNYGIELVSNTSEEITDIVLEMDDRISGRWQTNREDEELQQRFWSKWSECNGDFQGIRMRIGAAFLRQHPELLK